MLCSLGNGAAPCFFRDGLGVGRDDFPSSYNPVASRRCSDADAEGHVALDPAGDRIPVGIGEMDRQLLQSEFLSVWIHRGQGEEGGQWRGPRRQIEMAAAAGKAQKASYRNV